MTNEEALVYYEKEYGKNLLALKRCREKPNHSPDEEEGIQTKIDASVIAFEAIEKQIPAKPNKAFSDSCSIYMVYTCPTCGYVFTSKMHHCKCGQMMDWG